MKSYTIYTIKWLEKDLWDQYNDYGAGLVNDLKYYLQSFGYKVFNRLHVDFEFNHVIKRGGCLFVIQNNDTKQFFVIDFTDMFYVNGCGIKSDGRNYKLIQHPLLIGILKCQYRAGKYGKHEDKVSPWTYQATKNHVFSEIRHAIVDIKPRIDKIYFKGRLSVRGRSLIVPKLANMGILNKDFISSKNGIEDNGPGDYNSYLKDMKAYKIALSLPGRGFFCLREIEAFGVGIPVLMPIQRNSFYNDIVPNKHYIAVDGYFNNMPMWVDFETIGFREFVAYKKEASNLCDNIKKRFDDVIYDEDFLQYISDNAMKWFEENIEYPNKAKIAEKILSKKFNYKLLY